MGANAELDTTIIAHEGTTIAYASDIYPNSYIPFYSFMTKGIIFRVGLVFYTSHTLREQAITYIVKN